jgi:lantibiotic modifying enzyme
MGSAEWIDLAYGCLAHAEAHVQAPGLYNGIGGVAATFVELGLLFEDNECVQRGVEMIRHCDTTGQEWDMIGGAAGLLVALLGIDAATGQQHLMDKAVSLAESWLRHTLTRPGGLSTPESHRQGDEHSDPCGFAHGASGCALALELMSRTTGDRYWIDAADAFRLREQMGETTLGRRWMDLPSDTHDSSWCWGAAGIGAERLAAARFRSQTGLIADANAVVRGLETRLNEIYEGPRGPGRSHDGNLCVCHGVAGTADVLTTAAMQLDEPQFLVTARRMTALAQDYVSVGEIPCGFQGQGEQPGFMLGVAGLAYVLARLEKPEAIPAATLPPLTHCLYPDLLNRSVS